jgi:hypothetical protein
MLKMKMKNLNIFLSLVLVGLMYHTPTFLHDVATNMIGRSILLITLVYLALACEFSCSVIFALIIIVLFQNTIEGFTEGIDDGVDDLEEEEEEPMNNKEGMDEAGDAKDSAKDSLKSGARAGSDALAESTGVSFSRKISSMGDFASATYKNAMGLAGQTAKMTSGFENKQEGFLGMNFVKDAKLFKNLSNNIFGNMTDLDRSIKTNSEKATISSTKDFN